MQVSSGGGFLNEDGSYGTSTPPDFVLPSCSGNRFRCRAYATFCYGISSNIVMITCQSRRWEQTEVAFTGIKQGHGTSSVIMKKPA